MIESNNNPSLRCFMEKSYEQMCSFNDYKNLVVHRQFKVRWSPSLSATWHKSHINNTDVVILRCDFFRIKPFNFLLTSDEIIC